jgi:hypothetical protein
MRADSAIKQGILDVLTPPPSSGLKEFGPDDFDVDSEVPTYDSLSAAFQSMSGITFAAKALADHDPSTVPDPTYDLENDLRSRPEDFKLIKPFLDTPTARDSEYLLTRLADSQNQHETARILRQLRDVQDLARRASANGVLPQVLGGITAVGVDIAALVPLTGGALFGPIAVRSAFMARALSTARLGAFGAADAGGVTALETKTNPLIGQRDVFEAAGLGAGIGAFMGFASPTLLGNVRLLNDAVDNLRPHAAAVAEALEARGPRSVGAAAPGEPATVNVPARGSGSLVAGKVIPRVAQEQALRNPKRVIVDMGVQGAKDFAEKGLEGGRKFFDVMSRVVRLSTVMEAEVGGKVARAASVADAREQFNAVRITRESAADQEYAAMTAEVYGVGSAQNALRNNLPGWARERIGREQYEAMADEYAQANARGVLAEVEIIPSDIAARLTPDQRNKLMVHLERSAMAEDAYYERFGKLEVEHGLLKEKDLIPGYRPQRWNREAVAADPHGFTAFIVRAWSKQPDDTWLQAHYAGRVQQGEDWVSVSKRDPALADEILEDWSAGLRDEAANAKLVIARSKERELNLLRGESLMEIEERTAARIATARRSLQRAEEQLAATAPETVERSLVATRIAKIEKRIADEDGKLRTLRTLEAADRSLSETFPIAAGRRVSGEAADDFIRKFGNVAAKRAVKAATAGVVRAVNAEARTAARKLVNEQMESIRKAIVGGDSPFGMVDPEFIQSSSRFKRRNIHLGRARFTDDARRFLLTSSADARASYQASTGTQLALHSVFGDVPGEAGPIVSRMRAAALQGYDDDLMKTTSASARARIRKDQRRAAELFDRILGEMTGADIQRLKGYQRTVNDFVTIANTGVAASSLGGLVLSQFGDLAVQIMAGGRLGTGFRAIWRSGGVRKHIREIAKDEGELAVLIQGPGTIDGSRFRAIAELDTGDIHVPGGIMGRVMRGTSKAATIEGWANLAHVWNRVVRGGFGLDFARQMEKDFARYASLPPYLKSYYAKIGIDEATARDMADLMNRHHRTAVNGHLRYPNSAKWAEERPDLLSKYQVAMDAAGREAMLAPEIGDRPFLRSFPGGRLVLQFQSFMFTAGERFIGPMVQEMQLHPTSLRPYFAALAGLWLGAMTDGLKNAVRGEGEAWLDRWESAEGWKENLWGAWLRSPLLAGPTATLTDVAMSTLGRVANDRIQDIAGVRPFMQSSSRFREQQGALALLGPAVGLGFGTLPNITRNALEGDIDAATAQLARRIPILNVFYLSLLQRLATQHDN